MRKIRIQANIEYEKPIGTLLLQLLTLYNFEFHSNVRIPPLNGTFSKMIIFENPWPLPFEGSWVISTNLKSGVDIHHWKADKCSFPVMYGNLPAFSTVGHNLLKCRILWNSQNYNSHHFFSNYAHKKFCIIGLPYMDGKLHFSAFQPCMATL